MDWEAKPQWLPCAFLDESQWHLFHHRTNFDKKYNNDRFQITNFPKTHCCPGRRITGGHGHCRTVCRNFLTSAETAIGNGGYSAATIKLRMSIGGWLLILITDVVVAWSIVPLEYVLTTNCLAKPALSSTVSTGNRSRKLRSS
jgi:hypothetical protein